MSDLDDEFEARMSKLDDKLEREVLILDDELDAGKSEKLIFNEGRCSPISIYS